MTGSSFGFPVDKEFKIMTANPEGGQVVIEFDKAKKNGLYANSMSFDKTSA